MLKTQPTVGDSPNRSGFNHRPIHGRRACGIRALITAVAACLAGGLHAEVINNNVFLKGDYVEVGIHPSGSFGTEVTAPEGYHPRGGNIFGSLGFVWDADKDGWNAGTPNYVGDAFVPGTPEEGWTIEWTVGGEERTFSNHGLNGYFEIPATSVTETSTGDSLSSVWEGEAAYGDEKIKVIQTVRFPKSALYFVINVTMINTGSVPLDSVEYLRNVDPDHEQPIGGSYTTLNWVSNVEATGQRLAMARGLAFGTTLGLGTLDSRAVVSAGKGFENYDPDDIYDYPFTPSVDNPISDDAAISLAYRFGTLVPGQSVSIDYVYNLNEADLPVALGSLAAVTILQPTGTISGNTVNFQVTTNSVETTEKVDFYVGDTLVSTDSVPNGSGIFDTTFDSTGLPNGVVTLKATVTFEGGATVDKTTTVTIDNSGPPVAFQTPLEGATFAGATNPVEVISTLLEHPPVSVTFFRETLSTGSTVIGTDTEAPFTANFSVEDLAAGEAVTIKAVAADEVNRRTTIQVSGAVQDIPVPTETLVDDALLVTAGNTRLYPLANDKIGDSILSLIYVSEPTVTISADKRSLIVPNGFTGSFVYYARGGSLVGSASVVVSSTSAIATPKLYTGLLRDGTGAAIGWANVNFAKGYVSVSVRQGRQTGRGKISMPQGATSVTGPTTLGEVQLVRKADGTTDITFGGITANLHASRTSTPALRYHIGLASVHSTIPGGGFARASVRAAGSATVAGITPDGRPFSAGTMVNDNGTMAIFAAATRQVNPPALLGGELIVANLPTTDVTGEITWNKPAQLLGARGNYLGGVNTTLVANGSRYNNVIPLTGTGTLTLSGGNFLAPVSGAVEVTAGIPKVPTLGLTGWSGVRLTAGQFRAKVVVPGAKAVSGLGLYLPKSKTAWGYFPGTTLGGKIELVTP